MRTIERVHLILLTVVSLAFYLTGVQAERRALGRGTAPTATAVRAAEAIAWVNVRVFDGRTMMPRATVVVREGRITAVGADVEVPAGAERIDGRGRTLLPGLIDAHTHAWGDALERALAFGVTTELDMFTDHRFAEDRRREQREGRATARADLYSACTLVTAPGGHGTEYGIAIPTITAPAEAAAFVDARIGEGSDYIKIVYDDGATYGMNIPTIDRPTLAAVITAAQARSRLAVVHVGTLEAARAAIEDGADGLVHLFVDRAPTPDFADLVARRRAFAIPTLSVLQSITGQAGGSALAADERIAPWLSKAEKGGLTAGFPSRPGSPNRFAHALTTVKQLHAAGVPILAGTDAPNPGTAHGASLHRELELLVEAGLSPADALAAATSVPARVFGLDDRGRIAVGLRANLVLVEGDPATDITATRAIVDVWKDGVRVVRRAPSRETSTPDAGAEAAGGLVSDFDSGSPTVGFGAGWMPSSDDRMGGRSTVGLRVVADGAPASARGSLEVGGTLEPGFAFPWAGAMFSPGATAMQAANLSSFSELRFMARGDGRRYRVMFFAESLGTIPVSVGFDAGSAWQEVSVPFARVQGLDPAGLRAILFSAGGDPGPFRLQIDEVRFR